MVASVNMLEQTWIKGAFDWLNERFITRFRGIFHEHTRVNKVDKKVFIKIEKVNKLSGR